MRRRLIDWQLDSCAPATPATLAADPIRVDQTDAHPILASPELLRAELLAWLGGFLMLAVSLAGLAAAVA